MGLGAFGIGYSTYIKLLATVVYYMIGASTLLYSPLPCPALPYSTLIYYIDRIHIHIHIQDRGRGAGPLWRRYNYPPLSSRVMVGVGGGGTREGQGVRGRG